jgi:hypothetical protein
MSGDHSLLKVAGVGVSGTGAVKFLKTFWVEFKRFFANLFGGTGPQNRLKLSSFEMNKFTNDLYLSVQDDRLVVGVVEQAINTTVRADYVNLSTSVLILRDAVQANYPLVFATYVANGTNQTIFVTGNNGDVVDWRLITSILRINPEGSSMVFPYMVVPDGSGSQTGTSTG